MRTALLSDVHGNALALRTVADALDQEGIEHVVCLGDMAQGGPYPAECVALVVERRWPVVLGNADAFLLDPRSAEESGETVTEAMLEMRAWSRERLSDEHAAVIAGWPLSVDVDLGHGHRLLAFHATPTSYHPILLPTTPEAEFRAALGPVDATIAAGGHTHLQHVRRVGATTFVNPGSVGFGYDREQPEERFALDPWAAYAVIETHSDGLAIELRRVAFDARAVAASIRALDMTRGEPRAAMWERGARG